MTPTPNRAEIEALAAEYEARAKRADEIAGIGPEFKADAIFADECRTIATALRLLAETVEAKPAEWRVIYRYGRNQPMPEGHTVNIGNIQDAKQLPTGDGYEVTPLFLAAPSYASGVAEGIERAAAWHDAQAAEIDASAAMTADLAVRHSEMGHAAAHRIFARNIRALKEGE